MAQRVIGVDLGSHTVKVAVLEVGLRATRLEQVQTLPVPSGPEPALKRSLAALEGMDPPQPTDSVAVGFPGERVLIRLLEVPFSDPKKLGAVVGNELADDIPWELEDVVFDYSQLVDLPGKILAAAARTDEVGLALDQLLEQGIDPRSVVVTPFAYGSLVRQLMPEGNVLVVDVGHLSTNVCMVVNGRTAAARAVSRGGHQVTNALRQVMQLSYEQAEELKERSELSLVQEQALAPDQRQVVETITGALDGLVRELRITLGLFSAKLDRRPDLVLLCGGGSLHPGMEQYLSRELELPCQRMPSASLFEPGETALTAEGEAMGAAAMAAALEQGGRREVNLRQGEFAHAVDRSVFTEKLLHIAVAVVAVLVFAALGAYANLYALRKEEASLMVQLKQRSRQVLGQAFTKPNTVTRMVKRGCMPRAFGIPRQTAFDVLDMLSREIPGGDKVKLDLNRLDIKPGKTYLKGTADSRSAVGDIVKALQKNKCFSKISTGKISDVAEGKKQFSITISTSCF